MSEVRAYRPSNLSADSRRILIAKVDVVANKTPLEQSRALRLVASEATNDVDDREESLRLAVAASILADLTEQNWKVKLSKGEITIQTPPAGAVDGETVDQVKERIRRGLMVGSDRQLATKSVRAFIQFMERDRVHNGEITSIKSLIDNGEELASKLDTISKLDEDDREKALKRTINPVVQACEEGARCEFTGHKLLDIWRYCRHTWALEYNAVPGRTFRFIIRNKARKNWPIIGIAMLASPAANYYVRDHWVGWRLDDVMNKIVEGKWNPKQIGKVLYKTVLDSIKDIRSDDLVLPEELEEPSEATFFKLSQLKFQAVKSRRDDLGTDINESSDGEGLIVDIRNFDKTKLKDEDWIKLSETSLYMKKRSEQLLALLKCLRFFKDAGFESSPGAALCEVLITKQGQNQVSFALNEIRKRRIATEVADVSVCGAMEPYNHILGGKLVALLMASSEVQDAYRNRYTGQVSEIASQIAGKPITRSAELRVLTTTSLYGVASSQYNRLRLRAGIVPKLTKDMRWEELAKTQGLTVTHLSKLTIQLMKNLSEEIHGIRRINSVFGEGSSPKTRQVREGLNQIGITDDSVLKQGLSRRVYACEVYPNARADLHEFESKPKTRKPQRAKAISDAWIKRWVIKRITRDDVIERIKDSGAEHISAALQKRAECADSERPRQEIQLDLGVIDGDDSG